MDSTATTRPFPHLVTRSLTGTPHVLPDALPGPSDLVVCAFRRHHQRDVDAWRAVAASVALASPVGFWEVPILGRGWTPMRSWIDGGMTAAIADLAIRGHTLTAYTNVAAVCRQLDLDGPRAVVALLVREGQIVWRAVGPPNEAHHSSLAVACANLYEGMSGPTDEGVTD